MKTTDEAAGNPADFTWSNIPQLPLGKPAKDLSGKGKEHLVISGGEAGIRLTSHGQTFLSCRMANLLKISVERI